MFGIRGWGVSRKARSDISVVEAMRATAARMFRMMAFLARHDCLYGQGRHFGTPVEADRVAAMMAERGIQTTRKRRRTMRRRKAVGA